jgi:hypothetical protein
MFSNSMGQRGAPASAVVEAFDVFEDRVEKSDAGAPALPVE